MSDNREVAELAEKLVATIRPYKRCVVAFSAGVDSTVVAKAAVLALSDQAMAVTAVSPSLASGELDQAKEIAAQIGIRHEIIRTNEVSQSDYQRNSHDRCYHCKTELYGQLTQLVATYPQCVILNGTNTDDLGDYRPGLQAAAEHQVCSPMVDCKMDKVVVRRLAAFWKLPVWDKPAMPCLSSRIAYGVQVTPERLRMVDRAEQFLRELGFREFRVRYHEGNLARIEVQEQDLDRLNQQPLRSQVRDRLLEIGFQFVTVDLSGFRSGSLNGLVPIQALTQWRPPS